MLEKIFHEKTIYIINQYVTIFQGKLTQYYVILYTRLSVQDLTYSVYFPEEITNNMF